MHLGGAGRSEKIRITETGLEGEWPRTTRKRRLFPIHCSTKPCRMRTLRPILAQERKGRGDSLDLDPPPKFRSGGSSMRPVMCGIPTPIPMKPVRYFGDERHDGGRFRPQPPIQLE